MFKFVYFDGNAGDEMEFETYEEALREACSKWDRLTDAEKISYTDSDKGAYFTIEDEDGSFVIEFEVVF